MLEEQHGGWNEEEWGREMKDSMVGGGSTEKETLIRFVIFTV